MLAVWVYSPAAGAGASPGEKSTGGRNRATANEAAASAARTRNTECSAAANCSRATPVSMTPLAAMASAPPGIETPVGCLVMSAPIPATPTAAPTLLENWLSEVGMMAPAPRPWNARCGT